MLRILPDTLIKFTVNDTLKVMFAPPDGRPIGIPGKLAAGTATGMLKCVMVYPLDLARTRMAAGERFCSLSTVQQHGGDCSACKVCLQRCASAMWALSTRSGSLMMVVQPGQRPLSIQEELRSEGVVCGCTACKKDLFIAVQHRWGVSAVCTALLSMVRQAVPLPSKTQAG